MPPLSKQMRDEYANLFNTLTTKSNKLSEVKTIIGKIQASKGRYQKVADIVKIPWYFVAITHQLEASGNFSKHLHNGDALNARTIQVPKGRPKTGIPPFTWEESAIDALEWEGYKKLSSWSLSSLLFRFELYNGFGYRRGKKIYSPYLWSYSQHYTKGKYVADGHFDPEAISKQCGAAVLLKALEMVGEKIEAETETTHRNLFKVPLAPNTYNSDAVALQYLLNEYGYKLNPDGHAGNKTSDAVFSFTGNYLPGDNR
ncbi:MAG: hypothetical protein IPP71_07910 [Bacteroidetes bacterium]|nr:hypothetical protein [Bacteroidota bacterium]